MINCPICNKEMNYINNSHLRKHNLTPQQFKDLYPDFNHISDKARELMATGDKTKGALANKEKAAIADVQERQEFEKLGKSCKECGTLISFENRENIFCNHACSARFNNRNRHVKYSQEGLESLRKIGYKNLIYLQKANQLNGYIYIYLNYQNYLN